MTFPGFPEEITEAIRIPDQFFSALLLEIDNLDELKLTLYVFWRLDHIEGSFRYLRSSEMLKDLNFVKSLGPGRRKAKGRIENALQMATQRGTLLEADIPLKRGRDRLICINSPRGRAIVDAIRRGDWRVIEKPSAPFELISEHPNIYQLYESSVGPITPMIADALRDAEKTYPAQWVEEAFRIAVERNKRNWHYIEAILHRWQEGGRDDRKEKQDRRDTEKTHRKYSDWQK